MKMYILIKEKVPVGNAIVAAAHVSLATYVKYQETPEVQQWLSGAFYKVVCKVNESEFERAKSVQDHEVITESNLDNEEIAIGFKPRKEWPKSFRYLRLYRE